MGKNKKQETETKNTNMENNTNEQENNTQESTTMNEQENNTQESTTMNEQENNTQESTTMNEQENNTQESTTMNEKIVSQIAELLYGIDVNYDKYNTMQHDIEDMNGIIATISNPTVKNAMISERDKMQKMADIEHNNAFLASVRDVMNAVSVRMGITFTAKNTQKSTSAKTATNSDKYTYNDAIAEALAGGKTLKASAICEAIQKAGKLEAINTNPEGWKRAVSTALLNTNKYSRNENHEYSLLG